MIIIKIEGKGSIESALKTLKSKFIKQQTLKELNERKTYTKKSEKRRAEVLKAIYSEKKRSGK